MKRTLVCLAGAVTLLGAAPARDDLVTLHLRPVMAERAFAGLDVSLTFRGEGDGETVLALPDEWGGERELYRALRDLRAEGAAIAPGDGPAQRRLTHAPGSRITLHYRVVQDASGPPMVKGPGDNDYRPIIQPEFFQVLGNAIVVKPENVRETTAAAFRIDGMPPEAVFASDMEHQAMGRRLVFRDLIESVAVGGDFRMIDAGGGARLALRGTFRDRSDDNWRTMFAQISRGQRAYWRARDEPFLVTVLGSNAERAEFSSVGGTGRDDAFALFVSAGAGLTALDYLMAHESMHTWVPRRIGGLPEDNEGLDYWISEGFTDWATFRTLVQSGVWTVEDFAERFNESLGAYDMSPVRTAPAARIAADFWSSREVQKLPYQRGMLIATLWDHRIRETSAGARDFDDVLLALQRAAQRRRDLTAARLLPVTFRRVTGLDVTADIAAMAVQGAPVELPADALAPCGRIVGEDKRLWERGFDFDATARADWVIQGVVEGSNAFTAGLRDGMQLREWSESGADRDPAIPKTARVMHNGEERVITWLPAGREVRHVRRLELAAMDAAQREACRRRLAGL